MIDAACDFFFDHAPGLILATVLVFSGLSIALDALFLKRDRREGKG